MECQHKDSRRVKLFWNLYNDAYKEVNNRTLKYEPAGLCSDMAGYNFYFDTLSLTFCIMLHKNEQNTSKVANYKKIASNIIKSITRSLIIFKKPRKVINDFFKNYIFVRTFQWTCSECLTNITITVKVAMFIYIHCENG